MEAVLMYIALATLLFVPFVAYPLLKMAYELIKQDTTIDLLSKWIDKISASPIRITSWALLVSAVTFMVGLFALDDPARFTTLTLWVWLGFFYGLPVTVRCLEVYMDRLLQKRVTDIQTKYLSDGAE